MLRTTRNKRRNPVVLVAGAAVLAAGLPLLIGTAPAVAQDVSLGYRWLCMGPEAQCEAAYLAANSAAEANALLGTQELVLNTDADAVMPNAEPSEQLQAADEASLSTLADSASGGRSCEGGAKLPERTGTGYGYRTNKQSGNGYFYGWTLGLGLCGEWREYDSKGRPGRYMGTTSFEARVRMSGAGTGDLILAMRNLDGEGFYPYYSWRCRVVGEGRSCGSYPHERRSPIFEGQKSEINFAREGAGFGPLSTGSPRHDVIVTFSLDDLGEAPGTDRVSWDSDNFGCYARPNFNECIFD